MKNTMTYIAFAAFFIICSYYLYDSNQGIFASGESKALHVVNSTNKNAEVEVKAPVNYEIQVKDSFY